MKIYFTCSTADFKTHEKKYVGIRNYIVELGHTLTRDWLPKASSKIDRGEMELPDIRQIYKDNIKAIQSADLVIIEDTVSNFSTGHQITVALQRQKPTLVLWSEPKHRHFNQTFIQGIDSEFLKVAEYKDDEYKEIIRGFIKQFANARNKNRFHLVLSESEREYLDWCQYNEGISRTQVIRKLLQEGISKDEKYQSYLKV